MSESEDGFRDDEIERLHLSRLSNYSVATTVVSTGDDVIKSESATDLNHLGPSDLGIINEETDFKVNLVAQERHLVTESSLSNVADTMVANVLLRVAENELKLNPRDNQRLISPFPDQPLPVNDGNKVADGGTDDSSVIEVTPFPSAGKIFPFPSVGNVNPNNAVAPTGPIPNDPTSYDISTSSATSGEDDGISLVNQSDLNNQELAETTAEDKPKIELNRKRDDIYHTGDETERNRSP